MISDAWDELAAGVFRRRWPSLDLNVGLVLGEEDALVVDSRASHVEARELVAELRSVTSLPVRWVVATHWHWDHTFGNAMFPDAVIVGHSECRRALGQRGETARAELLESMGEERRSEFAEVVIRVPDEVFEKERRIDLGGRTVTVSFHGRGHTEGDVVVAPTDAPVVFAGDLFEESGPPWFGDGYPMAWPVTAAAVAARGARTVVPGHGDTMSPPEVATQVEELRWVADAARLSHGKGIPVRDVDLAGAPYPEATMREALTRAYAELVQS